jgi:monoamine oxidase
MARTPLFGFVRRAMKMAQHAARPGAPSLDHLFERAERRAEQRLWKRREMLGVSGLALTSGGLWLAGCKAPGQPAAAPGTKAPSGGPRVAIVGGGVAGLNCANHLKKVGIASTVYEASDRTGGRMFTAKDLMGPDLFTELGGEFIDSTHEDIMGLVKEFNLELIDLHAPDGKVRRETFFFNGRHLTEAQVVRAMVPLCKQIAADYDELGEVVSFEVEGGGKTLDEMSITQYLDKIGAKGVIRELLDVAYLTEYGLDCGEQSSLNLIFLIDRDPGEDGFDMFGESDERYKVKGGNDRVVKELAARLPGQILTGHALEAVRTRGEGFTLTFQKGGVPTDVEADAVVLALPFTLLREVKVDVPMPDWKRKAIRELGYGLSAKVFAGTSRRPWRDLGFAGPVYSDEAYQLAWDNAQFQPGDASGLTLFSGAAAATEAGQGTAEEAARRLLPGIERTYPGTMKALTNKFSRFHWPTHPFTKAGYSCFKVGQWTTIAGAEGRPVGNLFFAGEHCSADYQGYMNGGAETGRVAAEGIMKVLSAPAKAASTTTARRAVA